MQSAGLRRYLQEVFDSWQFSAACLLLTAYGLLFRVGERLVRFDSFRRAIH